MSCSPDKSSVVKNLISCTFLRILAYNFKHNHEFDIEKKELWHKHNSYLSHCIIDSFPRILKRNLIRSRPVLLAPCFYDFYYNIRRKLSVIR